MSPDRSGPPPAGWPAPHHVAVEGVRFAVHRFDPPRRRRTTPALLLHGVPETALCWRDLAAELARDRVVLAPDLKGLGGSEVVGRYDVATLVRELAALALHEVDGPVDVVGHDWGGVLGIRLRLARPELVRRLVVVNAPYRYIDLRRAAYIPVFALPYLPELLFRLGGRDLLRRMLGYAWRTPQPLDPQVEDAYLDAYRPPERITAMLGYYRAAVRAQLRRPTALARLATRGRLAAPRLAPTPGSGHDGPAAGPLVLWGADDPVLPLTVAEAALRDLGPGSRLVTVPRAGHFVVEEAPDVAIPAIAGFLRAATAPVVPDLP
jgi:pimeloyl-ACP methyl ester carboxylesterase